MPTLLDLLGFENPPDRDGRSFAAALRGTGPEPDPSVASFYQSSKVWGVIEDRAEGRFKLTANLEDNSRKLVQLDGPQPRANVETQFPEIANALYARLLAKSEAGLRGKRLKRNHIPQEEIDALRAMGYVD